MVVVMVVTLTRRQTVVVVVMVVVGRVMRIYTGPIAAAMVVYCKTCCTAGTKSYRP